MGKTRQREMIWSSDDWRSIMQRRSDDKLARTPRIVKCPFVIYSLLYMVLGMALLRARVYVGSLCNEGPVAQGSRQRLVIVFWFDNLTFEILSFLIFLLCSFLTRESLLFIFRLEDD